MRLPMFRCVFLFPLALLAPLSSLVMLEMSAADDSASAVANFSLPTAQGDTISMFSEEDADVELHVICFLGTECPLARIYGPRLQRMADEYRSQGVRFIGINSNVQDSMDDVRQYVAAYGIRFPVAKDHDRTIALEMKATRTPEVLVIDRHQIVRYRGRIDDQYQPGISRAEPKQHHLRDAIDQLLGHRSVTVAATEAVGCLISLPRAAEVNSKGNQVSFCKQVLRILQDHCIECHRQGEIGPFALEEYDEVVGWADMALEVIEQERMPPWHANPQHGSFANARHMPEADKQTLRDWVESGTPYGNFEDLPAAREYVAGWLLPESPHAVFEMSKIPFQVPAEGTVEYQYFVVDPGFKQDKWISAVQVIPGNRAVVHHSIAFTRPPDGADFRDIGMLAAYVPGQRSSDFPPGYAQRVPAGSKIVFQMHYTPTGKAEQDVTRIGMVFADPDEVTHEVFVVGGIEQEFEIPPHAAKHSVQGRVRNFPKDGFLLSIMPHMHLRGKSFQISAKSDSGAEKLLDVPHYDFNWQHSYRLSTPLSLRSVRSIKFTATFDNSADNPTNPDPDEYVTWGDQTWQEMAVVFVGVAKPRNKTPTAAAQSKFESKRRTDKKQQLREADKMVDRFIARFDKNGDGLVSTHELPISIRKYGYVDHNSDGLVSRREIQQEAMWRLQQSQ